MSGKGSLSYPRNSFSGFLKVTDARIRKNPDKLLLTWRTADIFKLAIETDPLRISSAKVNVAQPGFGWPRLHSSGNAFQQAQRFIKDILAKTTSVNKNSKGSKKQAVLDVAKINIKEGSAQYFDERMSPTWQTGISNIAGTIETIQSDKPSTETSFNLSASLAGSPITVLGSAKIFAPHSEGNSLIKVTTLPVDLFQEQIHPLLSIDPSRGIFDFVMNSKWIKGKKSGSTHYTFTSLTAASSESDTSVPIALLSDRKNIFQLYIPLDGNDQQSSRSLFNDTVNVFQTKLIKAKYSPILLAGHDFSDLVTMNTVQSIAGKKTISDQGRNVMGRYSDLVRNHPKLILNIIGMADPVRDGIFLKEKLVAQENTRVNEENKRREMQRKKREKDGTRNKQTSKTTQKKNTFMESNLPLDQGNNFSPIAAKPVTVTDEILRGLAVERAHEVYEQFIEVNNLTPEQLQLSEDVRISQNANQSGNLVVIELSARP